MSSGIGIRRAQTFQVGRRTFAAGLFWQPLKAGKAVKKDGVRFAEEHDLHFVVHHSARGLNQGGFASTGPSNLAKACSLAAVLVETLGPSWIAAFPLSNGKMVMAAAHDGAIVAGSDVMGPVEQVRQVFEETCEIMAGADQGWGRVIAPHDWSSAAQAKELDIVLAKAKITAKARIRPIKFKLTRRQIIAGVCFSLLVSAGSVAAKVYVEKTREADRLARIEKARLVLQEQEQAEINRRIVNGPWAELPPASVMIKMCSEGWSQVPLAIEGWLFENSRCSLNEMTAVYRRSGPATVGAFTEAVEPQFGDPIVTQNGDSAAITFSADMPLIDEGELPTIRRQALALLTHMQTHGVEVSLGDLRKGGVERADSNEVPAWHVHDFKFTTHIPPGSLFADLKVGGLRISTIDLELDHGSSQMHWAVTGDIYGK